MNDAWRTSATRVQVVTDRKQEWDLRMRMVKEARGFVMLTTYYVGTDDQSGEMLDALAAAARRRIRVVLVVDRFGHRLARNLSKAADRPRLTERLRAIETAGGRVVYYSPPSLAHFLVGGGLHVKIQLSDAGLAIFGSSNIAHHSFSQWNEVSLGAEGAVVSRLLQDACRFARLSDGETTALADLLPALPTSEPAYALQYVREEPAHRSGALFPFGTVRNRLTDELVRLIDSARRSLCITTLYCKPAPILKDALIRACRRGVAVEIFHSHRDSLGVTHLPWISASIQYGALLKVGACIYENHAGEHSKVILVDDREVAVGSYNLEHAAHDRLIEAMMFFDAPDICDHFAGLFRRLRRSPDNVALTPAWRSDLPLHLQVKRWLYRPLQRWL